MSLNSGTGDGANIDRLLNELHAKKRWLDEVISGLEKALRSPDMQFVTSIAKTFGEESSSRPKVDLKSRQQRKLARLASRVASARERGQQAPAGGSEAA
jgi:hypothetical protein